MRETLKKWIKENSMIVLLLCLFFLVPYALRIVDETAAAFDAGILHTIVVVCVAYAIFQICTWSVVKTIWPDVGQYFKSGIFSHDFKDMQKDRKVVVALCVYFVILISFILLTCAFI